MDGCSWKKDNGVTGKVDTSIASVIYALKSVSQNIIKPAKLKCIYLQFEKELNEYLNKYKGTKDPANAEDISFYLYALSSFCEDGSRAVPNYLHYINQLMDILAEPASDNTFALVAGSECFVAKKVNIARLENIIKDKDNGQLVDTIALALMTLSCAVDTKDKYSDHDFIIETAEWLAGQQNPDGSFGNLWQTAIAVETLRSVNTLSDDWNEGKAISYMEANYLIDIKDYAIISEVALALGGSVLGDLKCERVYVNITYQVCVDGTSIKKGEFEILSYSSIESLMSELEYADSDWHVYAGGSETDNVCNVAHQTELTTNTKIMKKGESFVFIRKQV